MSQINLEDEIIEKILGVDIQVQTNTGIRTLCFSDFENEKDSSLALNSDDCKKPRNQIVLTINCDGYLFSID